MWFSSINVAGGRRDNSMTWCLMYDLALFDVCNQTCRHTQNFSSSRDCTVPWHQIMLPEETYHCCWDLNKDISMGLFWFCQSKMITSTRRNSDRTCYFYENGKSSLFMHFFLTVHPPNSVFALYTSLAMLYVGYHGRKGFWKLKEKFLQHIQPNLWTVLIVIIFFF